MQLMKHPLFDFCLSRGKEHDQEKGSATPPLLHALNDHLIAEGCLGRWATEGGGEKSSDPFLACTS